MKMVTDPAKIDWLLNHAVENVYPSKEEVKKLLLSGKRLTVYYGVDPTGPSLHLGHLLTLKKLGEIQALGHEVILLIGDFTAMIGDPTDKAATRQKLTRQQVLQNCKKYKEQASRVISFSGKNPAKLKYNSKWLAKMTFVDVVELASHFTVQQMLERDMFKRRFRGIVRCPECKDEFPFPRQMSLKGPTPQDEEEGTGRTEIDDARPIPCPYCNTSIKVIDNGGLTISGNIIRPKPIYIHEFLYPLMQGYDSVAMDVDGEVGGNDQTFNMLAGRTLMRELKGKNKFVITNALLTDPSGKKMGKTEGNMIALTDGPEDMYGKVMSWTDGMIVPGFRLCTDLSDTEVTKIERAIAVGENPISYKHDLAHRIVSWLAGSNAADLAHVEFQTVHKLRESPSGVVVVRVKDGLQLVDLLVTAKLAASKSEARRLVEQKGVKLDGTVAADPAAAITLPKAGILLQKGKRHFVRVIPA